MKTFNSECLEAHEQSHIDSASKYSECPECGAGPLRAKKDASGNWKENHLKSECEAWQTQWNCLADKKETEGVKMFKSTCSNYFANVDNKCPQPGK